MEEFKISLTARRKILVQMYYRYLLSASSEAYISQDILDETQAKLDKPTAIIANDINIKLDELIEFVESLMTETWKWERLPALIGSILIIGAYEIKYTDTPKPVTINELVTITQELEPDFDFKFVNALLDKIGKM